MAAFARSVAVTALVSLAFAAPARAQAPAPRVFVSINAGFQPSVSDTSGRIEFEENVETATATIDYPGKGGPSFDGGVGVRLWRRLGIGLAVSRFSADADAGVAGRIPHPFFFEQPREISGTAGVGRTETGLHLQIMYIVPTATRFRIVVSAGPSRIEAEQDVVTGVRYDEEFPFEAATYRSAETRSFKASEIGFNAGADVSYALTRHVGVGGMIRFSRASMDLGPAESRISADAGGLQAGGGIRFAF